MEQITNLIRDWGVFMEGIFVLPFENILLITILCSIVLSTVLLVIMKTKETEEVVFTIGISIIISALWPFILLVAPYVVATLTIPLFTVYVMSKTKFKNKRR